ncbi:ATP-binding protein [Salipaludibacillus sp. CUR1]|uniref:ATP-binding protein n=1 Tax=Salipaludibacillus sp. CUR1 TaxID=2820003 RepID=UPI001E63A145|nr:ATP-binding protein [Salipaludibacillus sp. CUR1]MCE7791371.1 ATP-binding protein [Salipaludibacillus sp. CUR1]
MFRTLRSKLLLFFILIAFVPMAAVGVISYTSQKQEMTQSVERSLAIQSYSVNLEIKRFMEERLADAAFLAQNPVLMDPESSTLDIRDQLYSFMGVHDLYVDIILLDENGIVVSDTETEVLDQDLSEREWYQEALNGHTVVSDLYVSPLLDKPVMVVASPIYNMNQEIIGVVSPTFDVETLYSQLGDYTEEQQEAGWGGYTFLLNSEGEVAFHPDPEKVLNVNYFQEKQISENHIETKIEDGELASVVDGEVHYFNRIDPFPGFMHDWYVGVSVQEDELYSPLNTLLIRYLIFFSLVFPVLTYAVYRLSDFLVRPVSQLVESTKRVAAGNRDNQEYVYAYEEVNDLNTTFDEMTRQLEERESSHKKAALVLETTDNGVFAFDRKTKRITVFNRMCEEMFSQDKNDVIGMELDELIGQSPAFKSVVESSGLLELKDEEQVRSEYEIECKCGGQERTLFLSLSTLPTPEDETVEDEMLVVFYDLTEKRKMERELIRSEKLKVVGEMSAGFAHEIKNPLTTIKGFIQLFYEQNGHVKENYYQLVIEEIERVNKIMNELLNIANPNPEEKKAEINIDQMLEDILALYSSQIYKNHVDLETFFHGSLPAVEMDANKLKQVFINLIQNGIEAMPDGGRMNIRTTVEDETENDSHVIIQVEDTGVGMDKETIEKLGTPFFTTKKTGTGLGLTTSYRVIEEVNGALNVSSEQGKGTAFTIYLPAKPAVKGSRTSADKAEK